MSVKIFDSMKKENTPDPYKIETVAQMRKYTDTLIKFTSGV